MTGPDRSNHANEYFPPEHPTAHEGLRLWDSPDSLRVDRASGHDARPFRVLLAEDNPIDQINLRRLLEKQGSEVVLAGDGRAAVDIFESNTFDLVLLDILMPDMDGFEVALHIRGHENISGGRVPIIALTAYSLKAVFDRCRGVGMSGYLSKPVDVSDLRDLLSVLMLDSIGIS